MWGYVAVQYTKLVFVLCTMCFLAIKRKSKCFLLNCMKNLGAQRQGLIKTPEERGMELKLEREKL